MALAHKELYEKAAVYLKELVPEAEGISFEELLTSNSLDTPPNVAIVVLSYRDPSYKGPVGGLFSKKIKSIYIDPDSGKLLAIKNKLG